MSHLTDDDLVLHYYGEGGPQMVTAERHLETCADCAKAYEALTRTLSAVTAPEIVEAPDDVDALRGLLRASRQSPAAYRHARATSRVPLWFTEPRAIGLAWLVPALYPWSLPALFNGAQLAREHVGGFGLVLLTLVWACAGPIVALLVLPGIPDRFDRVSSRLRVLGALMATISPPLFMLVARGGDRLSWWYEGLAATSLVALLPWPNLKGSTARLRVAHRLPAALLGIFIVGHIVNQSLAFVSTESYAAMRSVMRVASQQSISYTVIVAMVAMQITTGVTMGLKRVGTERLAGNLQAVSGWYLAIFLLAHVFAGFLLPRPAAVAPVAASLVPAYALANGRAVAQLPYYVLGVAAFLLHVGLYARLAALAWFAESSVRRWSYAAAVAGAMAVATVGLSLCGIHILH